VAAVAPETARTALEDCRKAGADARTIGRLTAKGAVTLRAR
jgi:hydrogenase maturation factor